MVTAAKPAHILCIFKKECSWLYNGDCLHPKCTKQDTCPLVNKIRITG